MSASFKTESNSSSYAHAQTPQRHARSKSDVPATASIVEQIGRGIPRTGSGFPLVGTASTVIDLTGMDAEGLNLITMGCTVAEVRQSLQRAADAASSMKAKEILRAFVKEAARLRGEPAHILERNITSKNITNYK